MRVVPLVLLALALGGLLWLSALRRPPDGTPSDTQPGAAPGMDAGATPDAGPPPAADHTNPASPLARAARDLLDEGRADEALALLDDQASVDSAPADALCLRIDLMRLMGRAEEAMALGQAAADRWPDRSDVRHAWAQALGTHMREGGLLMAMRWMGTYKQQIAEAVTLDPDNLAARIDEIGFLVYAPALVGGDLERAKVLGEELRALDDAAGTMMVALAHDRAGDKTTAISLCQEALQRHPGHQDLGFVLTALLDETGRSRESLDAAERVLAGPRSPAWFRALYHRATVGLDTGRDAAACLDDLDTFLALAPPADFMPTPALAQFHRGRALERLGRTAEARDAYAAALDLDPELERARSAMQRLP